MDILLLVFLAVTLFGFGLVGSMFWSIFTAWRRAKSSGFSVSFVEAHALTKFYELEEGFMKACAAFKRLDPTISIKDVVRHHMADGDTLSLLSNWKKIKSHGTEVSFKAFILYDLSGKEVDEFILSHGRVFELKFEKLLDDNINISYFCSFKIDQDSVGWIEPNLQKYENVISEKIELAILAGDLSDFENLTSFIISNYLNDKFWKSLCHGIVVDQRMNISRG